MLLTIDIMEIHICGAIHFYHFISFGSTVYQFLCERPRFVSDWIFQSKTVAAPTAYYVVRVHVLVVIFKKNVPRLQPEQIQFEKWIMFS